MEQSAELLEGLTHDDLKATTSSSPSTKANLKKKLRIAVSGCSHGEMDKIYACASEIEKTEGWKFDLLICTGDYQAIRNSGDLPYMHVPEKYRHLQTFHRYYSGEIVAPILTLVIGGNHEASGYMQELPYGGWIAPRIYYLGYASVVSFAGLRIAGLSGIYNGLHYDMGHFERPPFAQFGSIVSVYHIRSIDIFRLKQLEKKENDTKVNDIDIMISHDWPSGITEFGDVDALLKVKPHFADDIRKCSLGNPATMSLLHKLRPHYWLSSHLHCSFPALVPHESEAGNDKNIQFTHFLALDKPIPGRHFLQALDIDVECDSSDFVLKYDPIWLTILRITDKLTNTTGKKSYMPSAYPPSNDRWDFRPSDEEISETVKIFGSDMTVPENFVQTAPPQKVFLEQSRHSELYYRNPQTTEFCERLGIQDLNGILCSQLPEEIGTAYCSLESEQASQTEDIDDSKDSKPMNDDQCFFIDKTPQFAARWNLEINRGLGDEHCHFKAEAMNDAQECEKDKAEMYNSIIIPI